MKVDKRRRVTPEIEKKMQKLRADGMTYQKISETVNLSYLTVYKYLNKEEKVKAAPEVKEEAQVEKKTGFLANLKLKLGLSPANIF